MADSIAVSCRLLNDKVHFLGQAGVQPPIDIDYIPPLGDSQGYLPLELLLLSLAACSAATLLSLLRRMGKTVSGCDVRARGIRRKVHPTSFSQISLEITLHSADVDQAAADKALSLAEKDYCPVWAMLRNNVEITATVTLAA